jgi:hypothetical protein
VIRRIFSICPHFVVQGEQLDQSLPKREYRKQDGYPDHSVCVPGSAAEGGADRAPVSSTTIATDCDKAQWPHALASIILDFLQPLLVNASHYSSLFTSPDLPLFCMTSAVAADLDTHTHTRLKATENESDSRIDGCQWCYLGYVFRTDCQRFTSKIEGNVMLSVPPQKYTYNA